MNFQVQISHPKKLAYWIEKIQHSLENEMQDGLFGNYMVDVVSLAVIGMLQILIYNGN